MEGNYNIKCSQKDSRNVVTMFDGLRVIFIYFANK